MFKLILVMWIRNYFRMLHGKKIQRRLLQVHDCAIFLERHMIHKNVEEVDIIEGRDEVPFPFTNNSQWGDWKKGKECRIELT